MLYLNNLHKPQFQQVEQPIQLIQDIQDLDRTFDMECETPPLVNYQNFDLNERVQVQNQEIIYDRVYGDIFDENIQKYQLDLSNNLINHQIQSLLRAKMINWMYEVFANFNETTNSETFIISIQLMDFFFKKYTYTLYDKDVHLIGISCIYIASKFNDIYHIPLETIYEKVGHKKFSMDQIKQKEAELLEIIDFQLAIPNLYKILNRAIIKNFSLGSSNTIKEIRESSKLILQMCLFDEKMHNFQPLILVLSVFVYAVKGMFIELQMKDQCQSKNYSNQQEIIIQNILKSYDQQQNFNVIENCIYQINNLISNFDSTYKDYINLQKYTLKD